MKRRDWKTKKLKKDIFGKFFRRRRWYFLRELSMRKYNSLIKKNFITTYYIYRQFIKNSNLKIKYNSNLIFNNNIYNNFYFFFPNFIFKKKIFGHNNIFIDLMIKNNINYIFVKKIYDKNNLLPKGDNIVLFNDFNKPLILKNLINEESLNTITFKFSDKFELNSNLNFFVNYNIYNFNLVEIYKIIIFLYLYNLNKNN